MKTLSSISVFLLVTSLCIFSTTKSHSLEFKKIYFPEGRPYKSESSKDLSNILDKKQLDNLDQLLGALKARPDIGVKVLGFVDMNECNPSACPDLSSRRARIVFDWLLEHGLSSKQLKGPEGLSTAWPLYNDASKEERVFNRRVDFDPFMLTESK